VNRACSQSPVEGLGVGIGSLSRQLNTLEIGSAIAEASFVLKLQQR
jgi:hypothetical protein